MKRQVPLTIDFLILSGVARFVMWLTFAVFHLFLAVVGLYLLWWYQVPPARLAGFLASVPDDRSVQWLALAGGSGATILALDCWAWRRIYTKLTTPYIFRDAKRAMEMGH
ncbi:hypothetical protein [Fimbriiglobus ruber]|uniref:hypothetical protein n=1 Tax=Fimbriiglobus ruber TaxID=1908690 RepID=UPI001179A071|nr:hypothetical protein [Fimbriiglobus ruber]